MWLVGQPCIRTRPVAFHASLIMFGHLYPVSKVVVANRALRRLVRNSLSQVASQKCWTLHLRKTAAPPPPDCLPRYRGGFTQTVQVRTNAYSDVIFST
jgi:hypothetical protein